MPALRLVLADQLTRSLSSLRDLKPEDVVLMAEVREEATYVRHHKQKIAFLFAAMRNFAAELERGGVQVRYVRYDDPDNAGSLEGEVARALRETKCERIILTECGEWRLTDIMRGWSERFECEVDVCADDRFVASIDEFAQWADGRKSLRMEYFYREMRKKTGLLMTADSKPEGGAWNFDAENRKSLPKGWTAPTPYRPRLDEATREVIDLVQREFADHFGDLSAESFGYATSPDQALRALDAFIERMLPQFGDYQDAMATGVDFLAHSRLSAYLNAGLLTAMEVCEAAEEAYKEGLAPLNAVEGFIRQIIGWREYVRGLYWLKMPDYRETNFLGADAPLPDFYWTGETDMVCMAEAVRNTKENAYAHHIQRLMVLGNYALLAGVSPAEIEEWFLLVYADAYEWVELPNVHGMAIFADGGVMASKPYAASGAYISRMSDHCRTCRLDPKKKTGDDACPFTTLYWDFLSRNRAKLEAVPRMGMMYKNLDRLSDADRRAVREQAKRLRGDA